MSLADMSLEEIKEELARDIDVKVSGLLFTFDSDKDLCEVHAAVVLNPNSRYGELLLQEKFKNRRMSAYRKLDELKSLGLINFTSIMDVWSKKISGEKLTEIENEIINKFNEWSKTMTEKQKRMYLSKTNYYSPTEKGLDKQLLIKIMSKRREIKQISGGGN